MSPYLRHSLLSSLALLSACAAGAVDNAGYLLPEQCRAPADLPHASIEMTTGRDKITDIVRSHGQLGRAQSAHGVTLFMPNGITFIFVADDLSPEAAAMTIRHERCHVLMGNWHS